MFKLKKRILILSILVICIACNKNVLQNSQNLNKIEYSKAIESHLSVKTFGVMDTSLANIKGNIFEIYKFKRRKVKRDLIQANICFDNNKDSQIKITTDF